VVWSRPGEGLVDFAALIESFFFIFFVCDIGHINDDCMGCSSGVELTSREVFLAAIGQTIWCISP